MTNSERPGGSLSWFIEGLWARPELCARVESWESKLYGTSEERKETPNEREIRIKGIWTSLPEIEAEDDTSEICLNTGCLIELHTSEALFDKFSKNKDVDSDRNQNCQGFVKFMRGRPTVENTGSIRCVVVMGAHNVSDIMKMLALPNVSVSIVITLGAAFEPSDHQLTLIDSGRYRWQGTRLLEIQNAYASLSIRTVPPPIPDCEPDVAFDYMPALQENQVEIIQAFSRIEYSVLKLSNQIETSMTMAAKVNNELVSAVLLIGRWINYILFGGILVLILVDYWLKVRS